MRRAVRQLVLGARAPLSSAWISNWALPGGAPSAVLDFVNDRYYAGGAARTLTAVVGGSPTRSASGLAAASGLSAIGALLVALQAANFTVVIKTTGGANSNGGLISFGTADGPLFRIAGTKGRNFINGASLDTAAGDVDWTKMSYMAATGSASGAKLRANQGAVVSNAQVAATPATVDIFNYQGGLVPTGQKMEWLAVYPFVASNVDMFAVNWDPPFLLPYTGANAIAAFSGQKLTLGTVMQFERTDAWAMVFAVNIRALTGAPQLIIGNPGSSGPYRAMELWLNDRGQPHARLMSAAFPGTNWIGFYGNLVVPLRQWALIGWRKDTSSLVSGNDFWVNGVKCASVTAEAAADGANYADSGALSGTIVSGQPTILANQIGQEASYFLNGGLGLARAYLNGTPPDDATMAAYTTLGSALPPTNGNCVYASNFAEASGTTVTDLSASGWDGTLSSAAMRMR